MIALFYLITFKESYFRILYEFCSIIEFLQELMLSKFKEFLQLYYNFAKL